MSGSPGMILGPTYASSLEVTNSDCALVIGESGFRCETAKREIVILRVLPRGRAYER